MPRHDTTRNQQRQLQRQQRRPTDPLTLPERKGGGGSRRNPWAALCQRVIDFPLTLMLLPFSPFPLVVVVVAIVAIVVAVVAAAAAVAVAV